jgi:ATP-binding cassette, subfamily C (CFTR/MRP), member 4
MKELNLKNKD